MKKVIRLPLKEQVLNVLRAKQARVDAVVDLDQRSRRAHKSWNSKEKSQDGKSAFTEIKAVLERMCNGQRRCMYCEEHEAADIEHVQFPAIHIVRKVTSRFPQIIQDALG